MADSLILSRAVLTTPIGEMLALDTGDGLCALEFMAARGATPSPHREQPGVPVRPPIQVRRGLPSPEKRLPRLYARLQRWFPPHEILDRDTPTIVRTREWLAAYFAGAAADIGDLPLDMRGAAFEQQVWTALRAIPAGETTSYGAIAKAVGDAGASRAVGAANGANPIAIIVPCHRVIGASGSLTGYGGGLERKSWLLDHERRWSRDPQPSLF